jgi:large subunit ribosomal protein L30
MAKVTVTKVKSTIDRNERTKRTMHALGLNKVGDSNTLESSPSVDGMIAKVAHLLKVEKA